VEEGPECEYPGCVSRPTSQWAGVVPAFCDLHRLQGNGESPLAVALMDPVSALAGTGSKSSDPIARDSSPVKLPVATGGGSVAVGLVLGPVELGRPSSPPAPAAAASTPGAGPASPPPLNGRGAGIAQEGGGQSLGIRDRLETGADAGVGLTNPVLQTPEPIKDFLSPDSGGKKLLRSAMRNSGLGLGSRSR
ncbi:unnamed protein product, partial [Discosporangium mesarthrocarpum]